MNLLFTYPVFLPVSSTGNGGDVPMEFIWVILIVVNAIWLISFIVAKIHNYIINKGRDYRDRLSDREYYFWAASFGVIIDIIAIFIGLVYWVATLL